MTAPPPPRPIRRGEWVEVRCIACGYHLIDIEIDQEAFGAFIQTRKRSCPKCGAANPEHPVSVRKAA